MQIAYAGGPIVASPMVYASFWGPRWDEADHERQAHRLVQFHRDLLDSTFMNVLTQYGILGPGTGVFLDHSFLRGVPTVLTVAGYRDIIRTGIDEGHWPESQNLASSILMIFLDEDTIINDPANNRQLNFSAAYDVGYHDHFTASAGGPIYYGFVAHSQDIDTTTVVASHEFAEMLTDPEYSAWTPDGGMTEIGDICDGQDFIAVGAHTWAVQPIWSDVDSRCMSQAPYPLPELNRDPAQERQTSGAAGLKRGIVAGPP